MKRGFFQSFFGSFRLTTRSKKTIQRKARQFTKLSHSNLAICAAITLLLLVAVLYTFIRNSSVHADSTGWDFSRPAEYMYDSTQITFSDSAASLSISSEVPEKTVDETPVEVDGSVPSEPASAGEVNLSTPSEPISPVAPSESAQQESPVDDISNTASDASPTLNQQEPIVENTSNSTDTTVSPEEPNTTTTDQAAPAPELAAPTESAPTITELTSPEPQQSITEVIQDVIETVIVQPVENLIEHITGDSSTPEVQASGLTCKAELQPLQPITPSHLSTWTGFKEDATIEGNGAIMYQISDDSGLSWYYWDGSDWVITTDTSNYNPATTINAHIDSFPTATSLLFKSSFLSDCNSATVVKLSNVSVEYNQTVIKVKQTTFKSIPPKNALLTDSAGNAITGDASSAYVMAGAQKIAYVEFVGVLDLSSSSASGDTIASLLNIDNEGMQHISKLELLIPKRPGQDNVILCSRPDEPTDVAPGCRSETHLSLQEPRAKHLTLVESPDSAYWHVNVDITGPLGIGGATMTPGAQTN